MNETNPEASSAVLDDFHRGGGFLFPFRHGYPALERLLERLPADTWRRDEAVLGGLVLLLVKRGQAARAKSYLTAVDLEFPKTDQFIVLELLLALHLGEPVGERKLRRWRRLERTLPISDPLLLGLYYNAMMAMYVRLGRSADARVTGQQAISCYREAGHVYLEHFIHIHLADLDVIEGRLHRATQGLAAAERCLAQSGVRYGNETEVIAITRLAIHYERGELRAVRTRAAGLRNSPRCPKNSNDGHGRSTGFWRSTKAPPTSSKGCSKKARSPRSTAARSSSCSSRPMRRS
ncbi:MAG: hypothetical protein QNJ13_17710 [Paracoccaceae bacterium]|nr:hypothetical protein [Paracoccaceae bacterium]